MFVVSCPYAFAEAARPIPIDLCWSAMSTICALYSPALPVMAFNSVVAESYIATVRAVDCATFSIIEAMIFAGFRASAMPSPIFLIPSFVRTREPRIPFSHLSLIPVTCSTIPLPCF